MTQEPRQELEVHGDAGEPVALPLASPDGGEPGWTWSLELPEGVTRVDDEDDAGVRASTPRVRVDRPGSEVVVATLTDPGGVAVTVLPVRVTVR